MQENSIDSDGPNDGASPGTADSTVPTSIGDMAAADLPGGTGDLEAQRERYLRLAADYDNFRRRTARDAVQERARGQGELIKGLLNSLDDLDRFAHLDPEATDARTVIDGVSMVERNIQKALAGAGIEIIDPVELPFDPNLHEAVTTQAAEAPDEDHMVAQVYQRGYMLNGQLLRPARVVVKQYQ
ncbi:MAG: nucleotide exchange factor GrpE [Gemmatimonadaceae bacterium]